MENEMMVIEEAMENVTDEVVTTGSQSGLKTIAFVGGVVVGIALAYKGSKHVINKYIKPAIAEYKIRKSKGTIAINDPKSEETEEVTVE